MTPPFTPAALPVTPGSTRGPWQRATAFLATTTARLHGWRVKPAMTAWVLVAASAVVHALPAFDEVRRGHRASDSLLLDRDGVVIHRLRTDATVRRGEWVALADISPALRTALVLSEDRRFYEHSGWTGRPCRQRPGPTCGTRARAVRPR